MYRLDGHRAYLSVGGECAYRCTYCYTLVPSYNHQRAIGITDLGLDLNELVLEHRVEVVKVGCDTEVFVNPAFGLEVIRKIAKWGTHISFATKQNLLEGTVEELAEICAEMESRKKPKKLIAFVSLLGREIADSFERGVPTYQDRVETVKRLYAVGIPTFVYMKPLMPTIPTKAIDNVIEETTGNCSGYVVGSGVFSKSQLKITQATDATPIAIPKWFSSGTQGQFFSVIDERIQSYLRRAGFFSCSDHAINYVL
ncbi:radical SAM protein [Candidatus Woesearchaeota archaeon]|nr:radical SAM protein [Candidatus Woesearchaeota archaeon]